MGSTTARANFDTQSLPDIGLGGAFLNGAAQDVALILAETGESLTYGELTRRVGEVAQRFDQGRGLALIGTDNSLESLLHYLAALSAGHPVVLLDEGSGHLRAELLEQFSFLYDFDCTSGQFSTYGDNRGLDLDPELALLLSTSGSTGTQKLVRLSRTNLLSNAEAICEYLSITPRDRAPTSLPMSYSYGLSVIHSYLLAGASILLTQRSVIQEDFWTDFDTHGCTSFAGVPRSFELLAKSGALEADHPKLRYMTQAGGRLSPKLIGDFARLGESRGWDFFVMYGQTEAAPRIAYLPPDLAQRYPESMGQAIPGGELRICDDAGRDVTEPGVEGELVYRGPNVMMGYALRDEDLALGRVVEELKTGDVAHRNEEGLFFITGRKSRFVKISGKRISLDSIDKWLEQQGLEGVSVGHDEALGVLVAARHDDTVSARLAELLGVPNNAVHVFEVDTLPLNQNQKIDFRAATALFNAHLRAKSGQGPEEQQIVGVDQLQSAVLAAYRAQFPNATITPEGNFQALGGSSNDFVDLELTLEHILPGLPTNWHVYSISDLAAFGAERAETADGGSRPRGARASFDYVSARAFVAILVVLYHVVGSNPRNGLELGPDNGIVIFNDMLGYLRMPMFAFLAGMTFQRIDTANQDIGRFFRNLGLSVVLPALLAIFLFAALSTVLHTDNQITSAADFLGLFYRPYAHFWFIMALVAMIAISFFAIRAFPSAAVPIMMVLMIGPILFQGNLTVDILGLNGSLSLFPYFAAGFLFGTRLEMAIEYRRTLLIIAAVAAAVLLPWALMQRIEMGQIYELRSWLSLGLGVVLVLICLRGAAGLTWLAPIASYSFPIYLWHIFGTSAARRVLVSAGIDNLALHVVVGLFAGLALPVAAAMLLSRIPGGRIVLGKY
jgi:acyl-CoA synthetase (AMP-forming)/AMP-acid ligase II